MNKRERNTIQECLKLLMADDEQGGDPTQAIGRLCELVGWRYPAWDLVKNNKIRTMTPAELFGKLPGLAGKPKRKHT